MKIERAQGKSAPSSHAAKADAIQKDLIRHMTSGRRLEIALSLYATAWEIKAGWLRIQHPAWNETEIQKATRHIFVTTHAGS